MKVEMDKVFVEYSSNNSGGYWWLSDDDWIKLEKYGWKVVWNNMEIQYDKKGNYLIDNDGMPKLILNKKLDESFLGAKARRAFRAGLTYDEAIEDWEKLTGENHAAKGCPCCGSPHDFTKYILKEDGEYHADWSW